MHVQLPPECIPHEEWRIPVLAAPILTFLGAPVTEKCREPIEYERNDSAGDWDISSFERVVERHDITSCIIQMLNYFTVTKVFGDLFEANGRFDVHQMHRI